MIAHPSDRDLQRAHGSGRLVVSGSDRGTRITDIFERSPIRIMFPKLNHVIDEAVLINTAGGIAGGDRLTYDITALPDASITLTTQAAEKVYRAIDEPGHVSTMLNVHGHAKLAWLPQETIVFNSARLRRQMNIALHSGAEVIALEWLVLGRTAHGERLTGGSITDAWRVTKDDRLIWADTFRVTDDTFAHLHAKALVSDCIALGTLIYFGPDVNGHLETFRAIDSTMQTRCAVSVVGELIIARFASNEPPAVRSALRSFLQKHFRVPKMWLS